MSSLRRFISTLVSANTALVVSALLAAACSSSPPPTAPSVNNETPPVNNETPPGNEPEPPAHSEPLPEKPYCEAARAHLESEHDPELACIRARVGLHCEMVADDLTEEQSACFDQAIYAEPECQTITLGVLLQSADQISEEMLQERCKSELEGTRSAE